MKRLLLLFGTFAVGVVLFGVLVSGVGWEEVWASLKTFSVVGALVLLVLTGAFLGAGAVRWQKVLEGQGEHIHVKDIWKPYLAGFALTFFIPIIPFANELFRASTLSSEQKIDFHKGAASVIIERILEITANLFIVVVGGIIFLITLHPNSFSVKLLGIIGFVAIWAVGFSFLYFRLFKSKSVFRLFWRGNGHIEEIEQEVFRFFHFGNRYFWNGMFLSLVRSLLGLGRTIALIAFLQKGLVLLPAVTILGFYYLGILVPIPAALGSHDALQAVAFETFGMGAGTGAAFALLIRAGEVVFALAGLLFVFQLGVRVAFGGMFKHENS